MWCTELCPHRLDVSSICTVSCCTIYLLGPICNTWHPQVQVGLSWLAHCHTLCFSPSLAHAADPFPPVAGKWGSVTTVCLMCVGAILLTACGAGLDGHGFMIFYIIAQFMFGYGVGGEYPMAAGSAAERAEAGGRAKASKRGMEVVLTFSMQGAVRDAAPVAACRPACSALAVLSAA